jgi:hypothetical protein
MMTLTGARWMLCATATVRARPLENYLNDSVPFENVVRAVMCNWSRGYDSVDDWEAAVIKAVSDVSREDA